MADDGRSEDFRDSLMAARADWAVADALQQGETGAVEASLRYLERDRWGFRTGYVKQRMFCYLRRYDLTNLQRRRLQAVLVACVDAGDRREFDQACRCARRFPSSELREELVERLHGDDLGRAVRAIRMLTSLKHPRLSDSDLEAGRYALLRWTETTRAGGLSRWVATVVRRLWSPEWGEELAALAAHSSGTDRGRGARRLLASIS